MIKIIREIKTKNMFWRIMYYHFAIYLPESRKWFNIGKIIRYLICKRIFEHCGKNVNIERGARFGAGTKIRIGDYSGIGVNCVIPGCTIIGKDVMMGPNCFIHSVNHRFERTDVPMRLQGATEPKQCKIDDDVWIGRDVTIMVGRHISKGTIVASNSVVTKDFPPYSVIGGNPAKLLKSRLTNAQELK